MSESRASDFQKGRQAGRGPVGGPPGMQGMLGVEKARNFKGTMITLLQYLKPYRVHIIAVFILSIAATVFSILGPKLLGNAVSKLFEGIVAKIMHVPGAAIDFGYIDRIVLLLLGLYLVSLVFNYIQNYIMTNVAMRVTYDLRKKVSEKINRLPLKYFDTKSQGEVLSHVTNDIETISASLNQSLSTIVSAITTLIGIIIMMFTINWLITLVALVIIPFSFLFIAFIMKKSQRYYKDQQDYLGHVNGHIEEMYSGHNVMQAFNGEKRSITKFDELNQQLYSAGWKTQVFAGLMMPVTSFISNLGYVIITILGGYLVIIKSIQVGDILAFIQYFRSFSMPINQLSSMTNVLQSVAAAAERVFGFLGEKEEVSEASQPIKMDKVSGSVSFKNVYFGYNPDRSVINNFSADIKSGQKIAIVGPTGAGKTTIVKLLMRFYDINKGAILVDGVDIREFKRKDLRNNFGMVLQDTWLFNGTVKDNIRYGKLNASEAEVISAAKTAHVDHFIHTLPGGYDTVINEDATNISQGQKQLITIARAFLADPKMLILDEATSSVDTRTEILIQKAMEELMKDRTSFIIAHRLSTIRNADLILVMKEGEIVEQGTHQSLLSAKGFYASLYYSQFEPATAENN
jgi:ATP-binding cassette, subfamily B, multidrug efflux pump